MKKVLSFVGDVGFVSYSDVSGGGGDMEAIALAYTVIFIVSLNPS